MRGGYLGLFLQIVIISLLFLVGTSQSQVGRGCSTGKDCGDIGLICILGNCSYCNDSSQCEAELGLSMICADSIDLPGRICRHKDILPPNFFDIGLSILLFVSGALAAGGGIGGGGVFVPLLILMGRFDPDEAIPLSTVLIGSASVANFLQMCRKRHPFKNKPLIDYNLATILQPLSLAGTLVGVILNIIFPNWLLLVLLVLVLSFTFVRTLFKGIRMWKKERERRGVSLNDDNEEQEELLIGERIDDLNISSSSELSSILISERKTPITHFVCMAIVLLITSGVSILKGGSRFNPLRIKPCSTLYWILSLTPLPILILVAIIVALLLIKQHQERKSHSYLFREGDLKWTKGNTFIMAFVSFFAGLMAGLLGIGGGIIFGPLMLEFKVLPEVAAATSSFMILFTSIAATIQYSALGRVIPDYAIWFVIVGFLCSFIGQFSLTKLVKKFRKNSLIILCIAGVIAVSTGLLITIGIMNIMDDIKAGENFGFQPLCQ